MSDPAASGTTPVLGLAAALTLMPFGVSLLTLMLGGLCFFGGCCARIGLSLYKKLEGPGDVSMKDFYRAFAMILCCVPMAAVASSIVFFAAHLLKIEADVAMGGLLLIMGVRGPEGFSWIMDTLASTFTKFLPGNKSAGGGQ